MNVELVTHTAQLAGLARDWNALARNPFCGWDWLEGWWRYYGDAKGYRGGAAQLLVLCVYDDAGTLLAVTPWYRRRSALNGYLVQFLGTGEVWSDHLTVPCRQGVEDDVAETLAQWLTSDSRDARDQAATMPSRRWDLLDLRGVDAADAVITRLAHHLVARGCTINQRAEGNCWRIELPDNWQSYLNMLSKSHRKQLRQIQRRYFDTGQAVMHTVENEPDLQRAWPLLVRLHQQRLQSLGKPGCFRSPAFTAFHRDVASRLLGRERLRLHWLELEGRPIAAEYHLAQDGVIYAYQGGIDPAARRHEPGRLITMAVLQRAIQQRYRAIDFLRGDEPYKAHWRANPLPAVRLHVISPRPSARLRYGLCATSAGGKRWLKGRLQLLGLR